jgi:hypothetical protein
MRISKMETAAPATPQNQLWAYASIHQARTKDLTTQRERNHIGLMNAAFGKTATIRRRIIL